MGIAPQDQGRQPFRAYFVTAGAVNVLLIVAGVIYAGIIDFGFATAAPVVAAFLVQASVYLAPGFPELRAELIRRYSPVQLASGLTIVSVLPYVIYSAPLGLFSAATVVQLLLLCGAVAFLFVVFPVRKDGLGWQDVVGIMLAVTPMISEQRAK